MESQTKTSAFLVIKNDQLNSANVVHTSDRSVLDNPVDGQNLVIPIQLAAVAPELLEALIRLTNITKNRWRSLPPDSEEKKAHNEAIALIKKKATE